MQSERQEANDNPSPRERAHSELGAVVGNLDEHLALVLSREEADEGVHALLEAVRMRLAELEAAVADVARHLFCGDVVTVGVVKDDELREGGKHQRGWRTRPEKQTHAFDLGALRDEVEVGLEALRVRVIVCTAGEAGKSELRVKERRRRAGETDEMAPQTAKERARVSKRTSYKELRSNSRAIRAPLFSRVKHMSRISPPTLSLQKGEGRKVSPPRKSAQQSTQLTSRRRGTRSRGTSS